MEECGFSAHEYCAARNKEAKICWPGWVWSEVLQLKREYMDNRQREKNVVVYFDSLMMGQYLQNTCGNKRACLSKLQCGWVSYRIRHGPCYVSVAGLGEHHQFRIIRWDRYAHMIHYRASRLRTYMQGLWLYRRSSDRADTSWWGTCITAGTTYMCVVAWTDRSYNILW